MKINQMAILAAITLGAAMPALAQTAPETANGTAPVANTQLDTAMPAEDSPDPREIIYLSAERRMHVLEEMRAFLIATQDIVIAIGRNDMQAAKDAADTQSKADPYSALGMRENVPETFYAMAQETRESFGRIAEAAKSGNGRQVANELGDTMTNCDVCHSTWQLREKK